MQGAARSDPGFVPSAVQIDATVKLGGQPAANTQAYAYALKSGTRVAEADVAVVLPDKAQYLFAAVAGQDDFDSHVADFNAILGTVTIAGP